MDWDILIRGGTLIDGGGRPGEIGDVAVREARIAGLGRSLPDGAAKFIDAEGLMVAPGFIDLHSHGQSAEAYRFKARDGVTTALEMEVGVNPVAGWYRER